MTSLKATANADGFEPKPLAVRKDLAMVFALLSVLTLAAGGLLTQMGLGPWYDNLRIPWFQPPAWAFTPAWTIIFVLLAIATWRIARHGRVARVAIAIYGVQLALNALWSLFFFPMQSPELALVDAVVLMAVVFLMILKYARIDPVAGVMLVPYAAWMSLATAINLWVVRHN